MLALVVGVWLGFGVRSVRLQDDADAVLARARTGPVAPGEVNSALNDYAKAGRLSPDQTSLIHQGELLYAVHQRPAAEGIALRAADAEPENLQAWFLEWVVSQPGSPQHAYAKKQVLKLNPWFDYALLPGGPNPTQAR